MGAAYVSPTVMRHGPPPLLKIMTLSSWFPCVPSFPPCSTYYHSYPLPFMSVTIRTHCHPCPLPPSRSRRVRRLPLAHWRSPLPCSSWCWVLPIGHLPTVGIGVHGDDLNGGGRLVGGGIVGRGRAGARLLGRSPTVTGGCLGGGPTLARRAVLPEAASFKSVTTPMRGCFCLRAL